MRTPLVFILLASLAFGQAKDAPLLDEEGLPPQGRTMELEAGETVPFKATCLDDAQALRAGKRQAGCAAEVAKLRDTHVSPLVIVLAVLGAAALGAVVTGGACFATKACR